MKPLKRPFADWVDDRVIPELSFFSEEHPVATAISFMGLIFCVQSLFRGDWRFMAGGAVACLVSVIWLAIRWDIRRRERRMARLREEHICLHCGYDMRATPEKCSECGKWADEAVEE